MLKVFLCLLLLAAPGLALGQSCDSGSLANLEGHYAFMELRTDTASAKHHFMGLYCSASAAVSLRDAKYNELLASYPNRTQKTSSSAGTTGGSPCSRVHYSVTYYSYWDQGINNWLFHHFYYGYPDTCNAYLEPEPELPPAPPEHCSNGNLDPIDGEIAIDCGGPCGECPDELYCPENTEIFWGPVVDLGDGNIIYAMECLEIVDSIDGVCPSGFALLHDVLADGSFGPHHGRCGKPQGIASIYPPDPDPTPPSLPPAYGYEETVAHHPPAVTQDQNGNTIETTITERTKTETNGTITTVEETRVKVTAPDGSVVSDTTTTRVETLPGVPGVPGGDGSGLTKDDIRQGNLEALNAYWSHQGMQGFETELLGIDAEIHQDLDIPDKKDIAGLLRKPVEGIPLFQALTNSGIQLSAPTCTIDFSFLGRSMQINFCPLEPALVLAGNILWSFVQLWAVLLFFRRQY